MSQVMLSPAIRLPDAGNTQLDTVTGTAAPLLSVAAAVQVGAYAVSRLTLVQVIVPAAVPPGAATELTVTLEVTLASAIGTVNVAVSHGPGGVPGAQMLKFTWQLPLPGTM